MRQNILLGTIIPYYFFDTDFLCVLCVHFLIQGFIFSISQSAAADWPAAWELLHHLHFPTLLLESLGIRAEIPEHHATSPRPAETSTSVGRPSPPYKYWKEQLALFVPANALWPPRGQWPCELGWESSDETQDSEEDRGVLIQQKGATSGVSVDTDQRAPFWFYRLFLSFWSRQFPKENFPTDSDRRATACLWSSLQSLLLRGDPHLRRLRTSSPWKCSSCFYRLLTMKEGSALVLFNI